MLGDAPGYLHVAVQPPGEKWREKAFPWPQEAAAAVDYILAEDTNGCDVYVCPVLLSTRNRKDAEPVQLRWVHADIDHADTDQQSLAVLGGLSVASGTPGHRHVYVRVTRDLSPVEYRCLAVGLRDKLNADHKITPTDMLRVPGTHNHKDPANPRRVADVTDSEVRAWVPKELARMLAVTLEQASGKGQNDTFFISHTPATESVAFCPTSTPQEILSRLDTRYREMIRNGDKAGYKSRSEARQAIATHMIQHDLTLSDFQMVMLQHDHGCAAWYENRDAQDATARDWAKAQAYVDGSPAFSSPEEVGAYLQDLRRRAQTPIPGRGGVTDRTVLNALLDVAMSLNRIEVGASVRDLADLVGRGASTVARSLQRLEQRGYIRRVTTVARDPGHSARFQLLQPDITPSPVAELPDPVPAHDYWSAVPPSARGVYEVLTAVGQDVTGVAEQAGVTRKTAARQLKSLREDGLVTQTPQGWSRATLDPGTLQEALDRLSGQMGFDGRLVRREGRHGRERIAYHDRLRTRKRDKAS